MEVGGFDQDMNCVIFISNAAVPMVKTCRFIFDPGACDGADVG